VDKLRARTWNCWIKFFSYIAKRINIGNSFTKLLKMLLSPGLFGARSSFFLAEQEGLAPTEFY